jgi:microcystin-dependent protein
MVKKIYFNGDIVTTGLVNSLYGAIPELTGAVGEDILASGHRHDGGDSEGHCGRIDLAREVRGILPITHIDTATLTTTVQTSVDSTVDAKIKAGDDALRLLIAANSSFLGEIKMTAMPFDATQWTIADGSAWPTGVDLSVIATYGTMKPDWSDRVPTGASATSLIGKHCGNPSANKITILPTDMAKHVHGIAGKAVDFASGEAAKGFIPMNQGSLGPATFDYDQVTDQQTYMQTAVNIAPAGFGVNFIIKYR